MIFWFLTLKKGNDFITGQNFSSNYQFSKKTADNVGTPEDDTRDLSFKIVWNTDIVVASGSGLRKITAADGGIKKIETGTYVASLYVGFKANTPIVITNNEASVTWVWNNVSTIEVDITKAIQNCFSFTYQRNWSNVTNNMYVGYAKQDTKGEYIIES